MPTKYVVGANPRSALKKGNVTATNVVKAEVKQTPHN